MAVESLNDDKFKEAISDGNAMVEFWAGWCGSCRLMKPKYKKLSDDPRFAGIKFFEIDAENNPEARKWASVSSLPFFAAVKDGNIIFAEAVGKEDLIVDVLNQIKAG
jgi:thiol-disulfide isomerase/thioredoxin